MGNIIFIKDKKVCIKPLRNRIEAILKLKHPKTPKGYRSFAGMVNFLSMFCPELQKLLKSIYNLTRKGRPFIWGKEQQETFEEIKRRLIKAQYYICRIVKVYFICTPILISLQQVGALYQIQNSKPKFIAYASQRLPKAVRSCSITVLELCGLAINIASFLHLLKRVDFNIIVDHLASMHIIESKAEPESTRIKRLLKLISSYSFNLCYVKGKDMILSDFLSRQMHDTSNYFIVASNTLYETYYRIELADKYLVQTQSQMRAAGVNLPEVHGAKKMIVTNMPVEKQNPRYKKNR